MKMIYGEKDGDSIVCLSIAEFLAYRKEGYSGSDDVNRQADKLLAQNRDADAILAACDKYGVCPMEALRLVK